MVDLTSRQVDELLSEMKAIRRRQWILLVFICVQMVWLTSLTFGRDMQIAKVDRAAQPAEAQPYLYYFGLEHLPAAVREDAAAALQFAICSLNSRVIIEQQLATNVQGVYRIDTRQLGWEKTFPQILREHYPYSGKEGSLPLVVRADWFIQFALDQEVNGQSYFLLLFGQEIKTLDQFFDKVGAVKGSNVEFGHIEVKSRVAVNDTRLIKTIPSNARDSVWITFDSREINGESDPLEHLDNKFTFDASEIIGSLVKSVGATGTYGALQAYALANAAGEIQVKAPADIVVDATGVRGVEIRNPISCMVCHIEGLRPLGGNAVREYVKSGAEIYAPYDQKQEIERFHLTNLSKLQERHNEDYTEIIAAINGLTPEANSQGLKRVVEFYDAPLTLEQAASEFYIDENELKLALGRAGQVPARIAQLAHGGQIPRTAWEEHFRRVGYYVQRWKQFTLPE